MVHYKVLQKHFMTTSGDSGQAGKHVSIYSTKCLHNPIPSPLDLVSDSTVLVLSLIVTPLTNPMSV